MNCLECLNYCYNKTLCDCFCTPTIIDYAPPIIVNVLLCLIAGLILLWCLHD